MTDIMTMTPEEIRLEIAKAKGIKLIFPFSPTMPYFENGVTSTGRPYLSQVPWWPTSISDAWELVEEMRAAGFWVQMRTPFVAGHNNDYWCGATPQGVTGWNGEPDNWTQAPTAPLAICRAYLAWKRALEVE
jgi:hypothetical protein